MMKKARKKRKLQVSHRVSSRYVRNREVLGDMPGFQLDYATSRNRMKEIYEDAFNQLLMRINHAK